MFAKFINLLTGFSVLLVMATTYLKINKIWGRKHEKQVAQSVSVAAMLIAIGTNLAFFVKFAFFDETLMPAMMQAIGISQALFFIALGSGLWVTAAGSRSFYRRFLFALRLEGRESADLVKAFLQPPFAREIMQILGGLVTLDKQVDEAELKLIQEFARQWKIEVPHFSAGPRVDGASILDVRESANAYLECKPDKEQASHLQDIMRLVGNADGQMTGEEAIVLAETQAMIESYLGGNSVSANFEVLLVPQNKEQIDSVRALLRDAPLVERRGCSVFLIDRFYSKEFAETLCQKYISLGIFAVSVRGTS